MDLPVIRCRTLLFTPLSLRTVSLSSRQASDPYANCEHTLVIYMRSFRRRGIHFDDQIFRILPAVVIAAEILALASVRGSPSALNLDPRYKNDHTFVNGSPSQ